MDLTEIIYPLVIFSKIPFIYILVKKSHFNVKPEVIAYPAFRTMSKVPIPSIGVNILTQWNELPHSKYLWLLM